MKDYWLECIEISFQDNGIAATKEQMENVAGDVEVSHENYGLAHGPTPPNPLAFEVDRLKAELRAECAKVHCRTCNGKGYITTNGSVRSSTSGCWTCRGEGRHAP